MGPGRRATGKYASGSFAYAWSAENQVVIRSLTLENFTAFSQARLDFGDGLNIIVGENGLGKTHLLKLPYALLAVSAEMAGNGISTRPAKKAVARRIAGKLIRVFRPESLGRLTRRRRGRARAEVKLTLHDGDGAEQLDFGFSTASRTEVRVAALPEVWREAAPVFVPTGEVLTICPWLGAAYRSRHLEIDETWIDICDRLGVSAVRGPREQEIGQLVEPLEQAMGGRIVLDRNGRFYLHSVGRGIFEMPLVAEGHRKFAMLARLVANGSLFGRGCLFWDEPESNLDPVLTRRLAEAIVRISQTGIQTFLATHSLFFLRELEMLLARAENRTARHRWFALRQGGAKTGVEVEQGDSPDELQTVASLDADLDQSDRFLREV